MLLAYNGSVEFLREHRFALGDDTTLLASAQSTDVVHLTKLFRSSIADREDATAVLRALRSDTSDVFTLAQNTHLSEIACACVSNDTDNAIIADSAHGSKKEQTHLFARSYYPEEMWLSRQSDVAVAKKNTGVCKA